MTFGTLDARWAARQSIHPVRRLAIGLLLSSAASAAIAQTTPPNAAVVPGSTNTPQQEETNSNAQAASENGPRAAQDSEQGLGAIIVTATKRETNLQRTPIAISVANTQALADRHADSLLDLGD